MYQGFSLVMTVALLGGATLSAYVGLWAWGQRHKAAAVLADYRAIHKEQRP